MMRFLYWGCTLLLGFLFKIVVHRYFTLYGVGPNVLMLMVLGFGFAYGSLVGELLGFSWGLSLDVMGTSLFGVQALLFTILGYVAGRLRRRVASDRAMGQIVVGFITTLLFGAGFNVIASQFEPNLHRISLVHLLLQAILNAALTPIVFILVDRWIDLWRIDRERI